MTNLPALARELAISVEGKLVGYSKRGDGGVTIRFQVHPNDIKPELRDAQLGTHYIIALVEVNEDGTPVNHKSNEGEGAGPSPLAAIRSTTPSESRRGEPSPDKPIKPRNKLAQRAGILSNDRLFAHYVVTVEKFGSGYSDVVAANYIRVCCDVDSRAKILPNTPAGDKFVDLEGRFKIWRDHPDLAEAG